MTTNSAGRSRINPASIYAGKIFLGKFEGIVLLGTKVRIFPPIWPICVFGTSKTGTPPLMAWLLRRRTCFTAVVIHWFLACYSEYLLSVFEFPRSEQHLWLSPALLKCTDKRYHHPSIFAWAALLISSKRIDFRLKPSLTCTISCKFTEPEAWAILVAVSL